MRASDLKWRQGLHAFCSRFQLKLLVWLLLIGQYQCLTAESDLYPGIVRLTLTDPVFRQISDSIAQAYRAESKNAAWPDFFVARYTAGVRDDLFSLAARFNLPYETLATLNRITQPGDVLAGRTVLIPSMAGIFVPENPVTDLEFLLAVKTYDAGTYAIPLTIHAIDGPRLLVFYPGKRFSPTERSFFLNPGFRLPVSGAVLSSSYGIRRSPIDGHVRMHNGIDLAAPAGTPVMAARAGTVVEQGADPVLGNFIIIEHSGGLRTVYGHLASIRTVLNQNVFSATVIGTVGSTGWSTGPHLHFEIRIGAMPRNPSDFLPGLAP